MSGGMTADMAAEERARDFILSRLRDAGLEPPALAVTLGSGQEEAAPALEGALEMDWEDIPGWPRGSVPGHRRKLRFGRRQGVAVMVQLGRLHYYEGLDMREVTSPARVAAGLGARAVLLTNAAGALNPAYDKGTLMLVRDHINLMGANPLRGERDEAGNPVFLDVSSLYDEAAGDALMERGRLSGWPLAEGVLVAVSGPTYETGAELRFMRLVGGDAVSMSLVPEALVARMLGMGVTGLSVITNIWDLRRPHPISHQEVLETARRAVPVLGEAVAAWLDGAAGAIRDGS